MRVGHGPIHRISRPLLWEHEVIWLVPDPRIQANTPYVTFPPPLVYSKSLDDFGQPDEVRRGTEVSSNDIAEDYFRFCADNLNKNVALTAMILSGGEGRQLETFPELGCWPIPGVWHRACPACNGQ